MKHPKNSKLILVKHAQPILDESRPAKDWRLSLEGEEQARRLALKLDGFRPFELVSSCEPKAIQTAELIAADLGLRCSAQAGLEEIDRPILKIVGKASHEQLNRPIFEEPSRAVLGDESADEALSRFSTAIQREVSRVPEGTNLVVVTHGTVISLFVARHNGKVEAWDLWKRLQCASCVVMALSGFRLEDVRAV